MSIELNRRLWKAAQEINFPLHISDDGKRLALHPNDESAHRHIDILQDLLTDLQPGSKIEVVDWPGTYHTYLIISG